MPFDGTSRLQHSPLILAIQVQVAGVTAKDRKNLLTGFRHKGSYHQGDQPQCFEQIVHDCGQAFLLVRILGQRPGGGIVYVLVAGRDQFPDGHQGFVESEFIQKVVDGLQCCRKTVDKVLINLIRIGGLR